MSTGAKSFQDSSLALHHCVFCCHGSIVHTVQLFVLLYLAGVMGVYVCRAMNTCVHRYTSLADFTVFSKSITCPESTYHEDRLIEKEALKP